MARASPTSQGGFARDPDPWARRPCYWKPFGYSGELRLLRPSGQSVALDFEERPTGPKIHALSQLRNHPATRDGPGLCRELFANTIKLSSIFRRLSTFIWHLVLLGAAGIRRRIPPALNRVAAASGVFRACRWSAHTQNHRQSFEAQEGRWCLPLPPGRTKRSPVRLGPGLRCRDAWFGIT